MKLTSVQKKIRDSMIDKCFGKLYVLKSYDIRMKIRTEIGTPNVESIQRMQIITLNNLKNEIN